jgi:hypothetical protein
MIKFFEIPALNAMFGTKRPTLRISDVLAENKILLVNLLGTQSDYDIAALIVAKFHQALFALRDTPKRDREPFYLYIDECHKVLPFIEDQADDFLTGGRKYELCLTLANQFPSALPGKVKDNIRALQTAVLFKLPYDRLGPFVYVFPKATQPKDFTAERAKIQEKLIAARDELANFYDDRIFHEDTYQRNIRSKKTKAQGEKAQAEYEQLNREQQNYRPMPDFTALLADLAVGQAVCIPEQGKPFFLTVRGPLDEHDKNDGCAEWLRLSTARRYPRQDQEMPHTKVNGSPATEKGEFEIQPPSDVPDKP